MKWPKLVQLFRRGVPQRRRTVYQEMVHLYHKGCATKGTLKVIATTFEAIRSTHAEDGVPDNATGVARPGPTHVGRRLLQLLSMSVATKQTGL